MKKFRVNVKRLTMSLGVLGTSLGLIAVAAWHKAPLAAYQPASDPALVAELDGLAGEFAPEPGATAVDPVQDLHDEELFGPKAGKHGPTDMMLHAAELGDARRTARLGAGKPLSAELAEPAPAPAQAAAPAEPAIDVRAAVSPAKPADVPLESGATGASALADASVQADSAQLADRSSRSQPLVTMAAMDPPRASAPRRSAVGRRPLGRIWRGEAAIAARPAGELVRVEPASFDAAKDVLAVPLSRPLPRQALKLRRLGDGRAYVDLPWSKPTFSGSRSEDVVEGAISRWVMAAHVGPGGAPGTRLAFRLRDGVEPRLESTGGRLTISFAAPVVGGARPAAAASKHEAAEGPRLGEARWDMAAGVLSIPVSGRVDPSALRFKRLGDGRAYLDVAGATTEFSGTRQATYPGQALVRWAMAGHETAGRPMTRVSFAIAKPGPVDVRLVGGEIRLTLPGHTGIQSEPFKPTAEAAAEPTPGEDDDLD